MFDAFLLETSLAKPLMPSYFANYFSIPCSNLSAFLAFPPAPSSSESTSEYETSSSDLNVSSPFSGDDMYTSFSSSSITIFLFLTSVKNKSAYAL